MYLDKTNNLSQLASRLFNYQGNSFRIEADDYYFVQNHWDGGSKRSFVLLDSNFNIVEPPVKTSNPFESKNSPYTFDIPFDHIIIEHITFRGRDLGIKIICREEDFEKYKPETKQIELTLLEKKVLYVLNVYKSNYRKQELSYLGVTNEEYISALESLKNKKLVSSRNSVTIEGKNLVSEIREIDLRGY